MTLTDKELRRAQRLNPKYQRRLGWVQPFGWPAFVASRAFALHTAEYQRVHGLVVDGILGPQTARTARIGYSPPALDASEHLLVAGKLRPVRFPVVGPGSPLGMEFGSSTGWSLRRRGVSGVNLIVLHWDGCATSRQAYHVLLERHLSTHLLVDSDATVYQALDIEKKAWHAGTYNDRSIGIEINNPVKIERAHWKPKRSIVEEPAVHRGRAKTTRHLDFLPKQKRRVVELVNALCDMFEIPKQLPTDVYGVGRGLMPNGFRGVCGHYHLSDNKPDPGLTLWPELLRSWQ